jgi:hypothetical protein
MDIGDPAQWHQKNSGSQQVRGGYPTQQDGIGIEFFPDAAGRY